MYENNEHIYPVRYFYSDTITRRVAKQGKNVHFPPTLTSILFKISHVIIFKCSKCSTIPIVLRKRFPVDVLDLRPKFIYFKLYTHKSYYDNDS